MSLCCHGRPFRGHSLRETTQQPSDSDPTPTRDRINGLRRGPRQYAGDVERREDPDRTLEPGLDDHEVRNAACEQQFTGFTQRSVRLDGDDRLLSESSRQLVRSFANAASDQTQVGDHAPHGLPVARLPVVDGEHNGQTLSGEVLAAVSDHHGGYYLGGLVSTIGDVARRNLADLRAYGSVDPVWHPAANGFVTSLTVSGSTVYAGGWFTSIGGRRRRYLAAISTRTGQLSA